MFQDIVIKTIFWYDVIIIKIFFFIMHLYLFPERVPLKPQRISVEVFNKSLIFKHMKKY